MTYQPCRASSSCFTSPPKHQIVIESCSSQSLQSDLSSTRRSGTRPAVMAAPPTDRPVTITLAAVWRLQVRPTPPRPPRLSAAVTVGQAVMAVARVFFGVVYFNECPQQPNIPSYLLGLALGALLMVPFVTFPCEREAAWPQQQQPGGLRACLLCLLSLFLYCWILAGDVWVFSVYQPSYDRSAADGVFCDKTLYTFALWNAVWETAVVLVLLAGLCRGLVCCVLMSPAHTHTNTYGHV
ncbi:transmembrane protein 272-like [Centropristis striata]|uniref:transmembrane protein 272-like n=1 Tax=Centropristis striata TaxID=184440 RepID=UPI0027DF1102|nr:transmembrane protein 272-like [Centropristis striata]